MYLKSKETRNWCQNLCSTFIYLFPISSQHLNTAFVWTYFTSLLHHLAKPELNFAHVHTHAQQLPVSPRNMSDCSAKTMKMLERILFCPKFSLSGISDSPSRGSKQNPSVLMEISFLCGYVTSCSCYQSMFIVSYSWRSQIQAITKWCLLINVVLQNLNANSYTNILIYTMVSIQLALALITS